MAHKNEQKRQKQKAYKILNDNTIIY